MAQLRPNTRRWPGTHVVGGLGEDRSLLQCVRACMRGERRAVCACAWGSVGWENAREPPGEEAPAGAPSCNNWFHSFMTSLLASISSGSAGQALRGGLGQPGAARLGGTPSPARRPTGKSRKHPRRKVDLWTRRRICQGRWRWDLCPRPCDWAATAETLPAARPGGNRAFRGEGWRGRGRHSPGLRGTGGRTRRAGSAAPQGRPPGGVEAGGAPGVGGAGGAARHPPCGERAACGPREPARGAAGRAPQGCGCGRPVGSGGGGLGCAQPCSAEMATGSSLSCCWRSGRCWRRAPTTHLRDWIPRPPHCRSLPVGGLASGGSRVQGSPSSGVGSRRLGTAHWGEFLGAKLGLPSGV